ncbi:MAG: hypothetical protein ABIP39_09750, partial [Polyangiaceae bacterium]
MQVHPRAELGHSAPNMSVLREERIRLAFARPQQSRDQERLLCLHMCEKARFEVRPERLNVLSVIGFEGCEELLEKRFEPRVIAQVAIANGDGLGRFGVHGRPFSNRYAAHNLHPGAHSCAKARDLVRAIVP